MTDKVLCPWCGAEMESKATHHPGLNREIMWNAWTSCKNDACYAEGPIVSEIGSKQEALEAARTAALRRYEPPCRPMTLDEAEKADYCYVTLNTFHECAPFIAQIGLRVRRSHENIEVLAFGVDEADCMEMRVVDYGKTWRCWPRKPTEEEREACGWEDAE